eukprot:scaffold91104_cov87-Phaeocystis_antarctica.AAC.2
MPTNLQVLEMYHVAGAWRALLTAPGCDITAQLSRDQYRQLREAMVRRTCTMPPPPTKGHAHVHYVQCMY